MKGVPVGAAVSLQWVPGIEGGVTVGSPPAQLAPVALAVLDWRVKVGVKG